MADTPPFWYDKRTIQAMLLWPISLAYGAISARRMARMPKYGANIATLCIGNFVAGGGGKTPTSMLLAEEAKKNGYNPAFLSRGHGGALAGPIWVDLKKNNAHDVGDEPMLLAKHAPTVVARDRVAGAQFIESRGDIDLIIMDDGFQSSNIAKDFCLIVVDASRGNGNGMVHPAGPLRVPMSQQILHTDAVLKIGSGDAGNQVVRRVARRAAPVFTGAIEPRQSAKIAGKKVYAWAGIANPNKFENSLSELGAEVVKSWHFADHQLPHPDQVDDLIDDAKRSKLKLVTTAKDMARLKGSPHKSHQTLAKKSEVLEIDLRIDDGQDFSLLFEMLSTKFKARRLQQK